jgi:adenylyl-sulfate kinase
LSEAELQLEFKFGLAATMKPINKVFWLFGRSGAGKTTLARHLRDGLLIREIPVVYLDGDEIRLRLNSDLSFKSKARLENHRRIAEIARLLTQEELNVIVSTMAPEHQHRDIVSQILGEKLVWFYIHAPLDVCMTRDPKGIYKRALEGQINELIDYPFEDPRPQERAHCINTVTQNIDECYRSILEVVKTNLADFSI